MKTEKIKENLIEIYSELAYIRGMLDNVNNQMQELQYTIDRTSVTVEKLRVREPYEHPWWKHQRDGSVSGGNSPKRLYETEEEPTLD
jgi:hypothetical protein